MASCSPTRPSRLRRASSSIRRNSCAASRRDIDERDRDAASTLIIASTASTTSRMAPRSLRMRGPCRRAAMATAVHRPQDDLQRDRGIVMGFGERLAPDDAFAIVEARDEFDTGHAFDVGIAALLLATTQAVVD